MSVANVGLSFAQQKEKKLKSIRSYSNRTDCACAAEVKEKQAKSKIADCKFRKEVNIIA